MRPGPGLSDGPADGGRGPGRALPRRPALVAPTAAAGSAGGGVRLRSGSADRARGGGTMSNHTYRVTEIVGSSHDSIDDAVRSGLERAGQTLRNLDWFEVEGI